jgi:hypothetical protein
MEPELATTSNSGEDRRVRGSGDINSYTLESLAKEQERLAGQNRVHQLELEGEGSDTLPEAINHIQSHFDKVISKIHNMKADDNLDESIAESQRLLKLYDKIKTNLHSQIDKYKEYSGENIKPDLNPSFVLASPLSPEAHALAGITDVHDVMLDDEERPRVHDQTIDEIISERDVDKNAAALLTKADGALGDLFTRDLGSPVDDLLRQEKEIADDAENPYGVWEAKIKFVPTLGQSSVVTPPLPDDTASAPAPALPSPDGVTIIPTTLDPATQGEVKITYVHNLPTAGGGMTLKSNLNLGRQGTVEADVVGEQSSHLQQFVSEPVPRDLPAPAPLTVPDGLLRPIIVPHEILHPALHA